MAKSSRPNVSEYPDPSVSVDTNAGDDAAMGTVADHGPEDAGDPMAPPEEA